MDGRNAYVVDQDSDDLKVIDVSGGEMTSLMAHSLEAGNLQVRNDILAQGQLQVTGGITAGIGGIFSDGDVGVAGTLCVNTLASASATDLCINNGVLSSCSSSIRYKENVKNLEWGLKTIENLRPVTFEWKEQGEMDFGFIAEEVAEINPLFVTYKDGIVEGVKYNQMSALFVNAFKEQQAEIDKLKGEVAKIETLKQEMAELRALLVTQVQQRVGEE